MSSAAPGYYFLYKRAAFARIGLITGKPTFARRFVIRLRLSRLRVTWRFRVIQRKEARILLFQRFFELISSLLPEQNFLGNYEALARLDPHKIYPENIRSILGVSSRSAQRIIDTAIRQGLFEQCVEVICPDGSVAASAASEDRLPETVRCWKEADGNYEEVYIATRELSKTVFYRLRDETAS